MGKKILLADDSITIQKVIELTFSDEDFDVVTVGNGRLALERLPEVRPDIVLCDIIMPEKDGYEVCEQIKSSPSWSHLPVLLLTGAFEPFDQERATRAGYDGSLAKPFEPETLIAKVKELLARASRPRPAATDTATAVPVPSFVLPTPSGRLSVPEPFPAASGTAEEPAPLAADFIPEEPFPGLRDAFAADAQAVTIPPVPVEEPEPLAEISEDESAALAPPMTFDEPAEDTVSTVMFRASDLPWRTPSPSAPAAAPPAPQRVEPEPAEEPLFVAEPPAPAERAAEPIEEAPVFESVLEEDLEFGGEEYPAEAEPISQPFDDTTAEPFGEPAASGAPQAEEDIFAPELTAHSPVPGAEEGASGAFAALVRDQVPVPDGASDTATFAEPELVAVDSEAPTAAAGAEPERHEAAPAHVPIGQAAGAAIAPELEEIAEQSFSDVPLEEPPVVLAPLPLAEQEPEVFESFEPASEEENPFEAGPAAATAGGAPAREALPPDEAPFEVAWPDEPLPTDEPPAPGAPAFAGEPLPAEEPAGAAVPEPPHALFAAPAPAEPTVAPAARPVAVAPEPLAAFPAAVADVPEESFGDVAETLAESQPQPPASETAALAVPVDMVEKIAQRVVAQISEKTVREIAWEVIPDLAEALIKQEIEKLKAELAKL